VREREREWGRGGDRAGERGEGGGAAQPLRSRSGRGGSSTAALHK
jgi:hypothetical protein